MNGIPLRFADVYDILFVLAAQRNIEHIDHIGFNCRQ